MLDTHDRARFLALLPTLATGGDIDEIVAFARAHREELFDEIGAVPGFDQIRAGALRVLPALDLDDATRASLLHAAKHAIDAFHGEEIDPQDALRRHPSWVALSALEWARAVDTDDAYEALPAVWVEVANAYARLAPEEPVGAGEVVWAVATVADEVGWADHNAELLESAMTLKFADESNRQRVAIGYAMCLAEADDPEASHIIDDALAAIEDDPWLEAHALWVGAHLDHGSGDPIRAIARLQQAIVCLGAVDDEDATSELAAIREQLEAWGVRSDGPAEA